MSDHVPLDEFQALETILHGFLLRELRVPCMIDVGAHHGTSLEPFLRAGWRVTAFEPVEDNRRQLQARLGHSPNLAVRSEAVSDQAGERTFHLALQLDGTLHEYHHSLEQFNEDPWHRKGPQVRVTTVTLDGLIERGELPSQVGYLKIDTEGHDLAVLRGAGKLGCEVVSVEFWNDQHDFGPSPSPARELVSLLAGRGYGAYVTVARQRHDTQVLYSTLEGTHPAAWGNLIFFHDSRRELYDRLRGSPEWRMATRQAEVIGDLWRQLEEKEAVLQHLLKTAREREAVIQRLEGHIRQLEANPGLVRRLVRWVRARQR